METGKTTTIQDAVGTFSHLLRHWRQLRRVSQLELAGKANVSARHLSFLESGRSQPNREMAQLLGIALDLPIAEQNALYLAAGFVPPTGDYDQAADNIPHVRQALDFILKQQEPYPAIVMDGRWDVRLRNESTKRMFSTFRQVYEMPVDIADNAMHAVFHPKGLRQFIVNWPEFAGEFIQILHREVARGSRVSSRLLDEIMVYPGLTDFAKPAGASIPSSPIMTMQLQKGDFRINFFSTFTTFAMPANAALQQLKIECFYPADTVTAETARKFAA
jgi:transcriptional regulator with XRE-family HTH domain